MGEIPEDFGTGLDALKEEMGDGEEDSDEQEQPQPGKIDDEEIDDI